MLSNWPTSREYIRNGIAKSFAVVALPAFAFAFGVGTGGLNTAGFLQARGEVGYRSPFISLRSIEQAPTLGAIGNLEFVTRILQLNQSELARALNVSRQTIYNWQDGESISAQNSQKLANLAIAAELFSHLDQRKTKELVRRKIGGITILEVVSQGLSVKAFAQQLLVLAARDEMQRTRVTERLIAKPMKANWINEFDKPHLSEEG
jgi:DNA-binding XRE family transcriptional regulator